MLAVLDHTADLPTAERSITPTTDGPAALSEQRATEYLQKLTGPRPTVRALAASWGWSKSRVDRFLSQHDSGTAAGQETGANEQLLTLLQQHRVEQPIATAANPNADDFDWSADNPDLVTAHQDAVCVYLNPYKQIVIRAEAREYGEEDPFIVVSPHHVDALIVKLRKLAHSEIG